MKNALGQAVRKRRTAMALPQGQLACQLGVQGSHIGYIEKGLRKPSISNVNKRRKEEAQKMNQLKATFGGNLTYVLFLCGYFDAGYLGYEASEGIDWIWEHRIDDFAGLGL